MKRVLGFLLAVLLFAGTSGCVMLPAARQEEEAEIVLPEPSDSTEPDAGRPVNQEAAYRVTFFYIGSDQQQLVSMQRMVKPDAGESLVERIMRMLLADPAVGAGRAIAPSGTRLLDWEWCGNIVTVNLSQEAAHVESDQQLMWMRAAIVNTLTSLEGISYVNVLIEGESVSLLKIPTGCGTATDGNLTTLWAQLMTEEELLGQAKDEEAWQLERSAVLYYPDRGGEYLVPEARTIRFTNDNYASALIDELIRGPEDDGYAVSPLPAGLDVFTKEPSIEVSADGSSILRLDFDANLLAILEEAGLPAWQVYASILYTVTGFVPEVRGITVYIGEGQVVRLGRSGREILITDGIMMRNMFQEVVGRLANLYFPSEEGELLLVKRVMEREDAIMPGEILSALIAGPTEWEGAVVPVMPEGVQQSDVNRISVSEGVAFVDLSAHFYQCSRNLDVDRERNLTYAMVNALTELPGIKKVCFQKDGAPADTFSGTIYLRSALIRNPGLMKVK